MRLVIMRRGVKGECTRGIIKPPVNSGGFIVRIKSSYSLVVISVGAEWPTSKAL